MRVLHVVRQFHPAVGGLESVVLSLARAQQRSGVDVEVLTLDRLFTQPDTVLPAEDRVDGIPVRRIPYRGSRRYPLAPGVLSHVKGFDLVHVHAVDFFSDFLAATARLHGIPMVLTTHGGFFHTGFARRLKAVYFRTITKTALRNYRRVFACSENDEATFRRIAGDRVKLIENGVDITKFKGAASPVYRPKIVYFGRFAIHKGVVNLVRAFAHVRQGIPNAQLVLIGSDSDGTLQTVRDAAASGLADGSITIRTDLSDADIASELATCGFFASASEYEGFGLTVVEALSAGLLPIVNEIPSFEKIITRAGVGHLTNFADPEAAGLDMRDRIAASANTHATWRASAIAAAEDYDWPEVERRYRQEYENVLGINTRRLLGVYLSVMSREDAVEALDEAVLHRRPLRVAFANAHTLRLAWKSRDLRRTLKQFLVLNDGIGVDLASRMKFGKRFPDNLNGTDFVPHYLSETKHRLRIFMLGAQPDVIRKAAEKFAVTWPQHTIVGVQDGYFARDTETERVRNAIRASGADLLLVAFGNPMQEIWIDEQGKDLPPPLQLGVGALFDFTAGRVSRAPAWVRHLKCEWVYRLAQEPKRLLHRYVVGNVVFLHLARLDRRSGFSS